MNNKRRTCIAQLVAKIEELEAEAETIRDEEQEYLDNMPENLLDSNRACAANDAIDNLDVMIAALTDAKEAADTAAE